MDTINENIIKKLKKYKIQEYNELKPLTQKMLKEIEEYMESSFRARLKAIDLLKNQKINIKRITDNTSISKGTIYNNVDTLKKYIDESIKDYEEIEKKQYNPDKYENALNANKELIELVDKLTIKLIDMNNLKLINEKLLSENDNLRKDNDSLIDEREELSSEIRRYKKQVNDLIKNGNNVISIKREKL